MNQHTPGPWTDERFETENAIWHRVTMGSIGEWAEVCGQNQDANARLIAAAPRMLVLIQQFFKSDPYHTMAPAAWVAEAGAILRDVEGESHGNG